MTEQLTLPEAAPTQKRRVLLLLRAAGADGVCVSNVPLELGYTMRNRISELRREGHAIEGAACHVHAHRSGVLRYVLREEA